MRSSSRPALPAERALLAGNVIGQNRPRAALPQIGDNIGKGRLHGRILPQIAIDLGHGQPA